MALIKCPDCATSVSDQAVACPSCARPIQPIVAETPTAPYVSGVGKGKPAAGFKMPGWVKWGGGAVLALVVIGAMIPNNTLKMVSLSSWEPLFGFPTVTAKMVNDGDGLSVNYWIKKKNSDTKFCRGSTFFAANERRELKFECRALSGYKGNFTFGWAPK